MISHATLGQKLQQELQTNEQVVWSAYPDRTRRATPARSFSLLVFWIVLRLLLLAGMLLVVFLTSVVSRTTTFLLLPLYGTIFLLVVMVGIVLVVQRQRTDRRQFLATIYAITTRRLLVITLDRDQWVQNTYTPADLGCIDCVERGDGWGDVSIGCQQRIQSPRLAGVECVREAAALLVRLKTEQCLPVPEQH